MTTSAKKSTKLVGKLRQKLAKLPPRTQLLAAVLVFAAVGTILLVSSKAATNTANYETEAGTRSGNASVVSDSGASGGSAVKFSASGGGCPVTKAHVPDGPDSWGGCWPGPLTTGVPAGTTLTEYTGPCTITTNNTVIDAKIVRCDMQIRAANVKITRSKFINGSITTDSGTTGYSFDVSDTEINIGDRAGDGISDVNYTATRVHITGGNRSIYCWINCTVTDSYAHAQFTDPSGMYHESAARMSSYTTYRHNAIACDAPDVPPDGGCSADLTGYGDFGVVEYNTLDRNLFLATTGGYCVYGGSLSNKPYPHANHIVFTGNVFQRGTIKNSGGNQYLCGSYNAVSNFDVSEPGNVWTNNKFDDGSTVDPLN